MGLVSLGCHLDPAPPGQTSLLAREQLWHKFAEVQEMIDADKKPKLLALLLRATPVAIPVHLPPAAILWVEPAKAALAALPTIWS